MSNGSPHPSLSPHRMRGEGGFSRVRGVPAIDVDWKLLLATTLTKAGTPRCGALAARRRRDFSAAKLLPCPARGSHTPAQTIHGESAASWPFPGGHQTEAQSPDR